MTLAVHQLLRRQHPKCVLVLAGVKPEEFQRIVRKNIKCDSSHIICAPPEHCMERLINVADCYLSTSRWEGFSLGLIEALAMNLPAVISRVTGNLDFIGLESEGVFLVPQGNAQGYVTKIKHLMDADIRGRNARCLVLERYSQKRIHSQFKELYRQLLETPTPSLEMEENSEKSIKLNRVAAL